MQPPEGTRRGADVRDKECGQIGGHQDKDQQGDKAGFPRKLLTEPPGTDKEAADEKAEDAASAGHGKGCGKVGIGAPSKAG